MGEPLVRVFEFRLVVHEQWEAGSLAADIEATIHGIYGITELQAEGFGHLLPRGFAEVYLDEPQATEVRRALETGEVT